MSEPLAVLVPRMNPNDDRAMLVRWLIEPGSQVAAGQPLAILETTKSNFDVEAPRAGYAFFDCAPRTQVEVGTPIVWIGEDATPPAQLTVSSKEKPQKSDGDARFTRKALRLMRERGIAPQDFSGNGRIDAAEVERMARGTSDDVQPLEQSPSKIMEVEALTQVYGEIVPSLVSLSVSCQGTAARLRWVAEKIGPVSLLELAVYEVARLLKDFPELNGYYGDGTAATYRSIGIGFAINAGHSLRVPVVQRAAERTQIDVARAVRELSLHYMRDELSVDDLSGGTFTITDLSSHGVEYFVPVVNQRQAAILGLCAERAGTGRYDLVLAFDHRMADGMRAAQFLTELRARLE